MACLALTVVPEKIFGRKIGASGGNREASVRRKLWSSCIKKTMPGAVDVAFVSKHAPIWRLGYSRNHSFRAVLEAGATLALRVLSS